MSNTKKILLVHRYYFPDTPAYAVMLKKIAEKLTADHDVSVLTSFPSYYGSTTKGVKTEEEVSGVKVSRIKLLPEKNRNFAARLVNTFLFAFIVFFKILFRSKYDVIMVATTPPVIMAFVVRLASRIKGSKYIYHCQDIYPEIAYYNKNLTSEGMFKFLLKVDKKNDAKASKIVVLSEDMKNTLVNDRHVDASKISIINNFIRTNRDSKERFEYTDYGLKEDDFIIVFCGNLGKLQNLDVMINLAKKCQDQAQIKFVFIGDGTEQDRLKKASGELLNKTVFFLGYQKSDKAIIALKKSHLGIVSISKPTYKTAYPSKTMTYLNAGLPILAILDDKSELAHFIKTKKIGLVAQPNDMDFMKETVLEYYRNDKNYDRTYIEDIAQQEFGEAPILEKWSQLFNTL